MMDEEIEELLKKVLRALKAAKPFVPLQAEAKVQVKDAIEAIEKMLSP